MIKFCDQCSRPLSPKRSNEAYEQYAKRRFCRSKCAAIWQRTATRQKWNEKHKTPVVRETIRAATEAEFLRLNGGPTICPPRYLAPTNDATMRPFAARPSRTF